MASAMPLSQPLWIEMRGVLASAVLWGSHF